VAAIVGIDDPAIAVVDADVTWPPQDVAHPNVFERHFRLRRRDRVGGPRQLDADCTPRLLD
jgi:hypothetical protein